MYGRKRFWIHKCGIMAWSFKQLRDFCFSPKHTDIRGKFGAWCKGISCATDIKANRSHKKNKMTFSSLDKKLNTDCNLFEEFKVNYFFHWNQWEGLSISVHQTCCPLRRVTLSGIFITICFPGWMGFVLSFFVWLMIGLINTTFFFLFFFLFSPKSCFQ